MPLLILHPVPPLPPLPTYFAVTFLTLLWSVLQAREDISVFEQSGIAVMTASDVDPSLQTLNLTHLFAIHEEDYVLLKYAKTMAHDSWSVLVLCNVAFCLLLVVGMALQWLIFGKLRDIERQHVRDKLWNFAFYKFIVVFGVLNVQTLEEMIFWVAWFATFAFLHAFAQLSKDRFEYLSFSPATTNATHVKVLALLASIFAVTSILGGLCLYVGHSYGWNLFLFMIAECALLAMRSLHVLLKYGIHLYDLRYEGVWERRGMIVYYTELLMELLVLGVDLLHHIHMLLWGNVFLSMASLVICLQIRFLYNEIQRRVQRHRNYRKVVHNMETRFSTASQDELRENDDDCAICWEEMKTARKLPCNHLFHDGCLRSWLEHETSCPTCRHPLNITRTEEETGRQAQVGNPPARPPRPPGLPTRVVPGNNRRGGHFFHFDGSLIASWMPSFSVEVTHANAVRRIQIANRNSQLNNMANLVVQMFPRVSHETAMNDLRITRSVELTVENILEGRLMETNVPQANPSSSDGVTSNPNSPASPDSEEESYSHLLRPPNSSDTAEGSLIVQDHSATSSTWHQVTDSGDESRNNTPQSDNSSVNVPSYSQASSGTNSYGSSAARFSKSSEERQSMLLTRKERLLQEARRKYAESQLEIPVEDIPESSGGAVHHSFDQSEELKSENNSNETSCARGEVDVEPQPEDELVRRRNAVLAATLRRLNQHS
ncbi:putative E3 ubiquitin-protein ligase AMFR [Apostichopus japonicus]|uniref:Putative E3 ubiquitin-protein ligase AMFR n=1 Tax=Stichopus japonicus TaxID=307972 RepID=A0A2G8JRH7_STIJA|nr:putative E3 ubiquitin-protein ligase AMFR [Apostichopus japonicus]